MHFSLHHHDEPEQVQDHQAESHHEGESSSGSSKLAKMGKLTAKLGEKIYKKMEEKKAGEGEKEEGEEDEEEEEDEDSDSSSGSSSEEDEDEEEEDDDE